MSSNPHWLTAKRLRVHGLILGLALWSVYIWTVATPGLRDRNGNLKGTDFLHLYTLGSIARAHDGAQLYDMSAQSTLAVQRVPAAAGIRYLPLYPPQVSLLFTSFARLPYEWALAWWLAVNGGIYAICCYAVWRMCPNLKDRPGLVALLAIAFPGFFHLIAWGQTSALALACFTLMFLLLRSRHEFLAGIAVGCLIFKPQLGLAAAVVFLAIGAWKIIAGAVLSSAVQTSAGILYYGEGPFRRWIEQMIHVRSLLPWLEPKPYQTHCLRTFCSMLVPWHMAAFPLYVVSSVLLLGITVAMWRGKDRVPLALRCSALLLTTVLVSPHLTIYDLVILAPAILLLADWVIAHIESANYYRIGALLYLVYALPLVGPITRWTHIQLSVIAMMLLSYLVWISSREEAANPCEALGAKSSGRIAPSAG